MAFPRIESERLPWMVASPVRSSSFRSLYPEHEKFNLEVDPRALPAFCRSTGASGIVCVYSDAQTKPASNGTGRLGSGRAGFYKGYHLKGIGRTPLAANWNRSGDLAHSTGHLSVAGACREFVVSEYARLKGAEGVLYPCEGVLVRRLDPHMRSVWRELIADPSRIGTPAMRELQAMSVKPGGFARISNFIWLFNQQWSPKWMSFMDVLRLMWQFLSPQEGDELPIFVSPEALCARLHETLERSLSRFKLAFELGITWSSMPNNTTFDGRIVDLETAEIFGRPFLGLSTGKFRGKVSSAFLGLDILDYLAEFRQFLEFLDYRLGYLVRSSYILRREEKVLAASLASALKRRFRSSEIPFSRSAIERELMRWLGQRLQVSPQSRAQLRELVRVMTARSFQLNPENVALPAELAIRWDFPLRKNKRASFSTKRIGLIKPAFVEFSKEDRERWQELRRAEVALLKNARPEALLEQLAELPRKLAGIHGRARPC